VFVIDHGGHGGADGSDDGGVPVTWSLTDDGAEATAHPDYTPSFYLGDPVTALYGRGDPPPRTGLSDRLASLRETLAADRRVVGTAVVERRQTWRTDPRPIVRVDAATVDAVRPLARRVHERVRPGGVTCYNVDLAPGLRFCLETGTDPTPARPPRTLAIGLEDVPSGTVPDLGAPAVRDDRDAMDASGNSRGGASRLDPAPGSDADHSTAPPAELVARLTCDGERLADGPDAALRALADRLAAVDPDVLVVDTARLVPLICTVAADRGHSMQLGRRPGYRRRAGASTYTSYGRVGHSPARYAVPGRAVVDRSNTFLFDETNLAGCLDLVGRAAKPLQELSWASIGTVLTAIQVRVAHDRGVLVPWRAWRPERPKPAGTLDDADRGGVTLAPAVGVHEDVHELDFASLYPNVIVTRNLSPETVRCDCCANDAVPGLDYSVCERDGYLPDVLEPLVADRAALKAERRATDDADRTAALDGRVSALKWILVSCFGYQGFSNAKFGRIECHEAINAYAREILLDAKARLEAGGWRVLHGVVDSLWVQPRADCEQTPLESLASAVTRDVGIELEYETAYDWFAFCPLRDAEAGALTRYFGRARDGSYTYRGIECRQRSTAPFVADVQRALIDRFDATRSPEAVCARLGTAVRRLRTGAVDPDRLVERARVSRPVDAYDHYTRTVAALERAEAAGRDRPPGTDVAFVVVDDDATTADRVVLASELDATNVNANDDAATTRYDADYYRRELLRAAASVLGPVGWDVAAVAAALSEGTATALDAFDAPASTSVRE
jgi:DNA polymerase I